MSTRLTRTQIHRLFQLLDGELREAGVEGEAYLVGGAVMCLALDARDSTKDVDAALRPSRLVREAAARVGAKTGVDSGWLNDAVKAYLSPRGEFEPFLELPNLKVFVAHPRYLLALKCASMRLGEEFHDLDDVRYLLRHLDVRSADEAMGIVLAYLDETSLLPKTRLILEEIFAGG